MRQTQHNKAFTIVELLTVMAVIALLIGLLVPALAMVIDRAKDLQQRTQFHAISAGLDMFKADFGDYPESLDNLATSTPPAVMPLIADPAHYGGAQKLAEAMVGYDLLGVHPRRGFRSDGQNYFPPNPGFLTGGYRFVYDTAGGLQAGQIYSELNGDGNIDARKDLYVELEYANAFQMQDVYGANTGAFNPANVVLCDVYSRARASGVKTGMPILYFAANTQYKFQNYADTTRGDIYNFEDNYQLLGLGTATTANLPHTVMDHGVVADRFHAFEELILNPQVLATSGLRRPYKAGSFILWSAGKDGVFGTGDDIFNFTREE